MNQIINTVNTATMSSREIADLTGKEHRHVLRDINVMFAELGLSAEGYAQNWTHPQNGQTYIEYALDRELTDTLLTGYSAVLRRKVIARWRELEAKVSAPTAPTELSRLDILQLAIESEKGRLVAVEQLAIASPKADALDLLTLADGSMCITNAAKAVSKQPKAMFAWLQTNDWIYRRPGGVWCAYQDRIKSGMLTHKITTVSRSDGPEKIVEQVLVTAKGLAKLAEVAI